MTATNPDALDFAEHMCVAMTFLHSLGITPETVRVASGRVECYLDAPGYGRAARRLIFDHEGTRHAEGDFLYVEARVDGVPVQVWTTVEERDAHESAQVAASEARENVRFASWIDGASL